MFTSCASLQDIVEDIEVTSTTRIENTCVTYDWIFREYVDCYTRLPIYRRPYHYGTRVIIKNNKNRKNVRKNKRTVRPKGRRGSTNTNRKN